MRNVSHTTSRYGPGIPSLGALDGTGRGRLSQRRWTYALSAHVQSLDGEHRSCSTTA